ncbi:MAG TPA: YlmH/Sll1252 family protein [Acholeplasma sp.]|nr:YlmH/Sll1252 family protein [Acholeplasma sp.]
MNSKNDFYIKTKNQADRYHRPILYRFLNPKEQKIVKQVFKSYDIYQSNEHGEYQRLIVSLEPIDIDFKVNRLKSSYTDETISHRDVLGALMNLGVNRDVFGDILLTENFIYIECMREHAVYIKDNLHQIKRDFVYFEDTVDDIKNVTEKHEEIILSVDSIRLDAIIAKVFKVKRDDVKKMMDQGHVKVNYVEVEKIVHKLQPCDIISVRGFGRIIFKDIEGISKKQKIRIKLHILR